MGKSLAGLIFGLMLAANALAQIAVSVVDVPSRGYLQRFLHVAPPAPVAVIIAIPGGTGVLGIADDGSMSAGQCGPIVRNRQAFAERGYALALVDKTSDGSIYNPVDVQEVVRYVQGRHNVPVWISGGSNSTEVVADMASFLPLQDPVGLIFFSPGLVAASVSSQIKRPTFIIVHPNDTLARGGQLYAGLTSAPAKDLVSLGGGTDSGCGNHLFAGQDAAFVDAVAGFVSTHNNSFVSPQALAVEYYNTSLDHYFLTHINGEIAILDAGVAIKGWARTGQSFHVFTTSPASGSPVCRFYIPPGKGDSHFYGRGAAECAATALANPTFVNEDPNFFHVVLPTGGACPAGTIPVYRVFSNRPDANHRYMTNRSLRNEMTVKGWLPEGDGADLVVMCAPVG
jgi:hypothetical protein